MSSVFFQNAFGVGHATTCSERCPVAYLCLCARSSVFFLWCAIYTLGGCGQLAFVVATDIATSYEQDFYDLRLLMYSYVKPGTSLDSECHVISFEFGILCSKEGPNSRFPSIYVAQMCALYMHDML